MVEVQVQGGWGQAVGAQGEGMRGDGDGLGQGWLLGLEQ